MLVKGDIVIGKNVETGEIIELNFDGNEDFKFDITSKMEIGAHVIAEPGSWVDGHCVLHGPLTYHGIQFPKDGGIHYNGCAFSHDGIHDKIENPYYREECVEYLLMQENFADLKL